MSEGVQVRLPQWLPEEVMRYLAHTEKGRSIREIARAAQCHASTVLRQVRRIEQRREDALVDAALEALAGCLKGEGGAEGDGDWLDEGRLDRGDIAHCLTLLAQPSAVVVAGRTMARAVILREDDSAESRAVVERAVIEVLALLGWIGCIATGRALSYRLTNEGRIALATILARAEARARVRHESQSGSRLSGDLAVARASRHGGAEGRSDLGAQASVPSLRSGAQETPLQNLARLTDREGVAFLNRDMVRAGERLREDYEVAQIGQHLALQAAALRPGCAAGEAMPQDGSGQAMLRLRGALGALGPGLSDIALRCCCHLQGLEAAERSLGWSARSGKIVLRIALEQLHLYYAAQPQQTCMIG